MESKRRETQAFFKAMEQNIQLKFGGRYGSGADAIEDKHTSDSFSFFASPSSSGHHSADLHIEGTTRMVRTISSIDSK